MNLFVLLKQVPDTETKIKLDGSAKGIDSTGVKWIISPYDEFAIEEALKTKEALKEGSVTVLTVGPDRCVDALRTAIAMGADNAIHVKTDDTPTDTYLVSKALSEALKKESPDLIFTGKQAVDDDQGAVFGYVAEFLDVPSAGGVIKMELADDKASLKAHREIEGGTKLVIEMPTPCLLGVDKGINTPRYASLPGIMKAKKKEIKGYTLGDLDLGGEAARCEEVEYQLPPERQAGKKIDGEPAAQAQELARLLREEAKVL